MCTSDAALFAKKSRNGSKKRVWTCRAVMNCFVIASLITLIRSPGCAAESEESSVSINKPITRVVAADLPAWVRFSPEYVRCFCNLPACVTTGYMCKSSGGGCFSDLLDQPQQALPSNVYRGIHGCLELLTDRDQRNWCQNTPSSTPKSTYRKKNHPRSLLLCCYHDMCNHADNPETGVRLHFSTLGEILNDSDHGISDSIGSKQDPALYTEAEVWFRAATIAVPICGAVILLALIGLAIRLLRPESSSSTNDKLGLSYMLPMDSKSNCDKLQQQSYRHHNIIHFLKDSHHHHHNAMYACDPEEGQQQSYLPLLIQNESGGGGGVSERCCDRKNETNAKLNYMQETEHCPVGGASESSTAAVSNDLFHKNTDLHAGRNTILGCNALERDESRPDKVYTKETISYDVN